MSAITASARRAAPVDPLPLEHFIRFRDLIEERCGIHFDESQRLSLSASLRARMQQLGLTRIEDYDDRLRRRSVDDEFRALINLVTITETCFFRDPAQFRLLRRHILPTMLAERSAQSNRTLRIWSAGCSTGEEAYSIAMTLQDMGVARAYPDWTFEIVGTDLNTEVLEVARRGVYAARAVRNVEGECLRRNFDADGPRFRLHDDIKRCVRFEYGNLRQASTAWPSGERQDVVFCKNVAIYFQPEVTRRVVRGLHEVLTDGGHLLLGHSESLWHMADQFSLIEHDGAYCYRKGAAHAGADERVHVRASSRARSTKRAAPRRARLFAPQTAPAPADASSIADGVTEGEYERCLAALRAGEWSLAETAVEALVRSCPTFVPAYLLLGGLCVHRGRYDEALTQAESVLRLNDLEARAHMLVGMIAARRGRQEEALQALRRALYLDDSLALAHFWLGNLYRDRGELERACREYRNVVRDAERHTLQFTEEFASDLSPGQIVDFCSRSLQRLDISG
jgi:chemotaxis protein methyltransferase CheR